MKRRWVNLFRALLLIGAGVAAHGALGADQEREITLIRSGGSRRNPEYQVTVRSDSTVAYVGRAHVYFVGKRNKTISPAAFERVWAAVQAVSFWSLADRYETAPKAAGEKVSLSDLPLKEVTVVDGDRRKTVVDRSGAPMELGELEAVIDFESGTTAWVKGPRPEAR